MSEWRTTLAIHVFIEVGNGVAYRDERLELLLGLTKHWSQGPLELVLTKIHSVDDHKGTLIVHWKQQPTAKEMAYLNSNWAKLGEWMSEHYMTFKEGEEPRVLQAHSMFKEDGVVEIPF